MAIDVVGELKELSELFPEDLYVVGGYVRNKILGIACDDIDLASSADIGQVVERLSGSKFSVKIKNLRLGAVLIEGEEHKFEYTSFRKETYKEGGNHCPSLIKKTDSLEEDAQRRDFSINSIYFNVNKNKIIDPFGGVKDIEKGVIKCGRAPEEVLKFDGERILRMIRFACELGFKVEKKTLKAAKAYVSNVDEIQGERKAKELNKILNCEQKYGIGNLKYGLSLLKKVGVLKMLGLKKSVEFKKVFKEKNRFYGFLIDVIDCQKPKNLQAFLEGFLQKNFGFGKKQIEGLFLDIASFYKLKRRLAV